MTIDILVPPLSQTSDTLVLVEWAKEVGEPVSKGEVLFRVETDKATLEVESPADGTLFQVDALPNSEIKVGSPIGKILLKDETPPGNPKIASQEKTKPLNPARSAGAVPKPSAAAPSGLPPERQNRIFASPRARNLAAQHGIELAGLKGLGSGPQGEIISKDVNAFLDQKKALPKATPLARRMAEESGLGLGALTPSTPGAPVNRADVEAALLARHEATLAETAPAGPVPPSRKVALSPTRLTIARRMRQSLDAAAPVTYMSEVDATRLVKLRKHILQALPEGAARPTYTDFLVYLACRALAKFPQMNATFDGTTLELYEQVHMGLAVDTERGLLVPVLCNAESLGIGDLAEKRSALVRKAQEGSLAPDELSGGTFTLTNLGTLGIDHFTPIINPPQVAILGMGRIREVAVVRKEKIRRRYVLGLAVTADHRVIDGAPAARFLQELCRLVEEPDRVWMGIGIGDLAT